MSKYGINVPKGVAVSSVEEVRKAIETTFPNEKEVIFGISFVYLSLCLETKRHVRHAQLRTLNIVNHLW